MKILVLNAGSSSLKCELYEADSADVREGILWSAQADWLELPGPARVRMESPNRPATENTLRVNSLEHTVEELLRALVKGSHQVIAGFNEIAITGHRVVHGGSRFRQSTRITEDVRRGIRELAPFAPLHNPLALEAIEAAERVMGNGVEQAAVFDTSFHASLPPESYLYPGPRNWSARGIRRYGFHGISHQYVSNRASHLFAGVLGRDVREIRMITCHLGNGCSLCAVKGGISVETTMGFTPIEGLMMGSRSGTVDPGVLVYLLQHEHTSSDELDRILNHESGLRGLSGVSSDMREVSAAVKRGNGDAAQALAVYTYRLAYFVSALLPALGGLDLLVFAGGVGENSEFVRAKACERLKFLGIKLDVALNGQPASDRLISALDSQLKVAVVRTRENLQIARECVKLLPSRR
jgi:acetate kinase